MTRLRFDHLIQRIEFGRHPNLDCSCNLRIAGTTDADLAEAFKVHVRDGRQAAGLDRAPQPNRRSPEMPGNFAIPFGRRTEAASEERMLDHEEVRRALERVGKR